MATPDSDPIIVGIGASAGGVEALKEFFSVMPADSGMAFVVVQHLDPERASYMAEILAKCTPMSVIQADDGMALEPNRVYTIPPDKYLFIRNGSLHLIEPVKRDGMRMPIDFFFRSLAESRADKAIAVLLSGSGSDGTLGLREIHGAGGVVIVQDPTTAQFDSMLQSALATGMVDSTLPVSQMPAALVEYYRHTNGEPVRTAAAERAAADIMAILDVLANQTQLGFQSYRKTMLWRRIWRRMGLNRINDLADYVRLLRGNPQETERLAKDMLIGVTSFFRDPEAFEELRAKVIAPLVEQKPPKSSLRAWTVGCATGEEAYSLAILIREEMLRLQKSFPVQIFASDVAVEGLKYARESLYPESIAADISEDRLARFFVKKGHSYQVNKEIREMVTFASHNVLVDPPFLRMDLISCRNLLIYIETETQKRLHGLFAFALNPAGHLFLGKSESVEYDDAFQPVSREFRIYRRVRSPSATSVVFPVRPGVPAGLEARSARTRPTVSLAELNQEVLLKHFDAAIVLTDERGQSLHFYGPANRYLSFPAGDATLNLFDMVDRTIAPKLRLAVERAFRESETVRLDDLELEREGVARGVDVTVSCCVQPRSGIKFIAVIFQEKPSRPARPAPRPAEIESSDQADYIAHLEAENRSLKDELQTNLESFHASYEEFTSTNEELVTMNEELHSTNEELETAKEELQSVNEELVTVNNQINENMLQLAHVNDDLANFLNSSEVVTIFLDTHLCVRRFTAATTTLLNLLPQDVGRPVEHISSRLVDMQMTEVAREVLRTLVPVEREVRTSDGAWYMMRCVPYRTLDNKIDGVVLTFTDVTRLKQSETSIENSRRFAQSIVDTVPDCLLVLDAAQRVVSANRGYYAAFQTRREDTESRRFHEIGGARWNHPDLRRLLDGIVATGQEFNNFQLDLDLPALGPRTMLFNARRLQHPEDREPMILLAIEDYTDRKRASDLLTESEEQMRRKADELEQQLITSGRLVSLGEIAASMAHEFNNPLGIIMGFAEELLAESDPSSAHYEGLRIIADETRRCRDLILSLMQFARPGTAQPRPTDIAAVIERTLRMMDGRFYKQRVTVSRELQPGLPALQADSQQLEQVFINLYLNALDAMPEGGALTVSAALDGAGAAASVVIAVADTGTGMDESELERIFQPFYTARKRTGFGLGLPICDRIVKNHRGRIEVESRRDRGTTFRIHLPAHNPAA